MSRARNIKPGFYKNEDLAECSVWARLLFPGLWMLADREGRLEDRPRRIKGEIFPFDSVEVDGLLDELAEWRFIKRYQVDGKRFIQVLGFLTHQNPHGTEKDSAIPDEAGYLTVNQRSRTSCVTGKSQQIRFDATPSNVNPPLSNVNLPSHNALNPSSLNPDSLNPESLNPESSPPAQAYPTDQAAPRDDSVADDSHPAADSPAEPPAPPNPPRSGTRAGELCLILRPLGVTATPGHPDLLAWANGLGVRY